MPLRESDSTSFCAMNKNSNNNPTVIVPEDPAEFLAWTRSQRPAARERNIKFEQQRRAANEKRPTKTIGTEMRFGDVEVGNRLIFHQEKDPTIYTKTEPVKITTGPHKSKMSEISYELKGETRRTVCSDPECIVWVVD